MVSIPEISRYLLQQWLNFIALRIRQISVSQDVVLIAHCRYVATGGYYGLNKGGNVCLSHFFHSDITFGQRVIPFVTSS